MRASYTNSHPRITLPPNTMQYRVDACRAEGQSDFSCAGDAHALTTHHPDGRATCWRRLPSPARSSTRQASRQYTWAEMDGYRTR